jgi:hypothetical protein
MQARLSATAAWCAARARCRAVLRLVRGSCKPGNRKLGNRKLGSRGRATQRVLQEPDRLRSGWLSLTESCYSLRPGLRWLLNRDLGTVQPEC